MQEEAAAAEQAAAAISAYESRRSNIPQLRLGELQPMCLAARNATLAGDTVARLARAVASVSDDPSIAPVGIDAHGERVLQVMERSFVEWRQFRQKERGAGDRPQRQERLASGAVVRRPMLMLRRVPVAWVDRQHIEVEVAAVAALQASGSHITCYHRRLLRATVAIPPAVEVIRCRARAEWR